MLVTAARDPTGFVYGYVVTVALNGQNFDHEEFQLLYLKPPRVHEVRSEQRRLVVGGIATKSIPLKIIGSHWAVKDTIDFYRQSVVTSESLLAGEYPNTLSCVFYAPMSNKSSYWFAEAQNPECNGDLCEATCHSPILTDEETDQGILYTQVFMSMNRRDPCMRCGCQKFSIGHVGRDALNSDDHCLCADPGLRPTCLKSLQKVQGWDFDSLVSRYDSKSHSFCNNNQLSHTLFCGDSVGCPKARNVHATSRLKLHDCFPSLHFSNYTLFMPPVVLSIEPGTIAQVNNQTITLALSGRNFNSIMWTQYPEGIWRDDAKVTYCGTENTVPLFAPVVIKAIYQDATTMTFELREATYDFCQRELLVSVPIPCASEALRPVGSEDTGANPGSFGQLDPWRGCFAPFKNVRFNQSNPELRIDFELSLNNGIEFSRAGTPLLVYAKATCPSIGCGHGTCLTGESLTSEATTQCVCNVWDNPSSLEHDQGCSRDGRVNPKQNNQWVDGPWAIQGADPRDWVLGGEGVGDAAGTFLFCPANDKRRDLNDLRPRTAYPSGGEILCTEFPPQFDDKVDAFKPFSGGAGALNFAQPGLVKDSVLKRGRSELSCTAGPTVDYIWPTLGSTSGGTTITVDMSMWWYPRFSETPWQYFGKITDASNDGSGTSIACYFRDCQTSSPAIIQDPNVQGVLAKFKCSVPAAHAGMTNLSVSMRNTKGGKSPLDFPGTFNFLYYTRPLVFNIRLMNGATLDTSSFAHKMSAPICTFCARADEERPEGRVLHQFCMAGVTDPTELHPIGADCPQGWKIYVNGTGFVDSDLLECEYALADRSARVATCATWISSQAVGCAIPISARGEWQGKNVYLKITLDGQVFTEENHVVDFYPQPTVWTLTEPGTGSTFKTKTTAGFGVDWRESDLVLKTLFGVDQVHRESSPNTQVELLLEKVPEYFRRAPTKGGTPLALYLADGCSTCSDNRTLVSLSSPPTSHCYFDTLVRVTGGRARCVPCSHTHTTHTHTHTLTHTHTRARATPD